MASLNDEVYKFCLRLSCEKACPILVKKYAKELWEEGYKAPEWETILEFIFGENYVEKTIQEWGKRK